jgi:hypothetical protein
MLPIGRLRREYVAPQHFLGAALLAEKAVVNRLTPSVCQWTGLCNGFGITPLFTHRSKRDRVIFVENCDCLTISRPEKRKLICFGIGDHSRGCGKFLGGVWCMTRFCQLTQLTCWGGGMRMYAMVSFSGC